MAEQGLLTDSGRRLKWWALALAASTVVVGLLGVLAIAVVDDGVDVPTGAGCEQLAERESPDLQLQAERIVADDASLVPFADCDSGGYASVYGGAADHPDAIVRRMGRLGDVDYVENTECLEYLEAPMCDEVWYYRPRDGGTSYIVSIPRGNSEGEFGISVDR